MIYLFAELFLGKNNRFCKYLQIRKRAKTIKRAKDKIPPYLKDNNFITELNYKLWVTKGARFKASERCEELDRRSARLVGWFSAYLIIFSVLSLCNIPNITLPENYSSFISISLSIMILVFSQLEYAKNYSIKAKEFHNCALEISSLYNKLRFFKTQHDKDDNELLFKMNEISVSYELILQRYENHLPIDYADFQTTKPGYFNLSKFKVIRIKIHYFFKTEFINILCIYGLPIMYILMVVLYNKNK